MKKDLYFEIAKYLPNEFRKELVQRLFEVNNRSVSATSRDMQTTRAQLYRYLGLSKRRNYPSERVTARALRALHYKHPGEAIYLLQQQASRLQKLIEALAQAPHPSISTGERGNTQGIPNSGNDQ
ncbi:MAG: hypothetical protein DRJ69_01890 [Thermoprotei archaeon]|nr:MAG: hypothetical protein DRJ69_01890 [Thermoprotei archaeon]